MLISMSNKTVNLRQEKVSILRAAPRDLKHRIFTLSQQFRLSIQPEFSKPCLLLL